MEGSTGFIVTAGLAEVGMVLDFKVVLISKFLEFPYIVCLHPPSTVGLQVARYMTYVCF